MTSLGLKHRENNDHTYVVVEKNEKLWINLKQKDVKMNSYFNTGKCLENKD